MQSDDCFAREVGRGEGLKGAARVGREGSQGSVARDGWVEGREEHVKTVDQKG